MADLIAFFVVFVFALIAFIIFKNELNTTQALDRYLPTDSIDVSEEDIESYQYWNALILQAKRKNTKYYNLQGFTIEHCVIISFGVDMVKVKSERWDIDFSNNIHVEGSISAIMDTAKSYSSKILIYSSDFIGDEPREVKNNKEIATILYLKHMIRDKRRGL